MRRGSRPGEPTRRGRSGWRLLGALSLGLWIAGCGSDGGESAPNEPFEPPAEVLRFEFDGRSWEPGLQQRIGRVVQEIYVLPGESTTEWTELVTRTLALGAQRGTDMEALLETQKKQLETECPIVEFTVLAKDRRSSMYEWSRPQCKELAPQTQIGRTIFGVLGVHTVTYTAKSSRLAPGLRKQWLDSLRSASLEQQPRRDDATAPRERDPAEGDAAS